jgi:hypothetical protein
LPQANRITTRAPTPEGVSGGVHETADLISSDKVEGTAVYDRQDNQIGTVHSVMIEKVSGQVAYAVLSFGGLLGFGERHHPLPWGSLSYDTRLGGYATDMTQERLRDAPSFGSAEDPFGTDPAFGGRVREYYGVNI